MREDILNHYKQTGTYTYAGAYTNYFKSLPDKLWLLGKLICSQTVNGSILRYGNTNANADLKYGDMNDFPWYRLRNEDDVFLTAISMTGELFRLNSRGFYMERNVADKIVVTCRHITVLIAAILKAKGRVCRCRAGFADYVHGKKIIDHWYDQIWDEKQERWINLDASLFFDEEEIGFSQYDIPNDKIDWAANTWLGVRDGSIDGSKYFFVDGTGVNSLEAIARQVVFDFHALMNNEMSYNFNASFLDGHEKFINLTEDNLKEIDYLSNLLLDPDENFDKLVEIWNTNKKFRTINAPQISDWFHVNK